MTAAARDEAASAESRRALAGAEERDAVEVEGPRGRYEAKVISVA